MKRNRPPFRVGQKRRFRVFERDGFRCVYCGRSAVDGLTISISFHEDHAFPKKHGGADIEENIVTCCSDCNIGKKDSILSCYPPAMPKPVVDYCREMNASYHKQQDDYLRRSEKLSPWDREVIEVLVSVPDSVGLIVRKVGIADMESPAGRCVLHAAHSLYNAGRVVSLAELLLVLDDPVVHDLLVLVGDGIDRFRVTDPRERLFHFVVSLRRYKATQRATAGARRLRTERLDAHQEAEVLALLVENRRAAQGMCQLRRS